MPPPIPFNLMDEKFVNCLMCDGKPDELTLLQVFERAGEIREIFDDSPLTTVAMLRPLLALLHACVWQSSDDGERRAQWLEMWHARRLPMERICEYSQAHHARFDLFSEDFPFYQTATLAMKEASPLSRLAMEEQLPSAIFRDPENPLWRDATPALAARLLITAQSFVLGFGKSGRARLEDRDIEPPYSKNGVLLGGLTLWLAGNTLLETLLLNLVPEEAKEGDCPAWDLDRPFDLRDQTVGTKVVTKQPRGVMDRLTWQSRLIRLLPEVADDGSVTVPQIYFTQGRSLSGEHNFDPMKTYRKGKEGFFPLGLGEHKAAWRDAHVLMEKPSEGAQSAAAVRFIGERADDGQLGDAAKAYGLHVVGMAAEPGKAANFRLWRHERMPLPPAVLASEDAVSTVRTANDEANAVAVALNERMRELCRRFLSGGSQHKPHKDDVTNLAREFDARRAYWPRLEPHFHEFLRSLPDDRKSALEVWRDVVQHEAIRSFAETAHALGYTARAIAARAQVSGGFLTPTRLEDLVRQRADKAAKTKASTRKPEEAKT